MQTYEHNDIIGDENYMTRDYANRRRFNQQTRSKLKALKLNPRIMIAAGCGVAAIILAIAYKVLWSPKASQLDMQPSKAPVASRVKKPELAKQETPQFDFYTLLPNMAVEVPDEPVEPARQQRPTTSASATTYAQSAPQNETRPNTAQAPATPTTQQSTPNPIAQKNPAFIVQAGSFRQPAQAEELKAMLALNGFEARIQTVKIDERDLWYRVFIGPFGAKEDAMSTQQKLEASQSVNSLILKIQV